MSMRQLGGSVPAGVVASARVRTLKGNVIMAVNLRFEHPSASAVVATPITPVAGRGASKGTAELSAAVARFIFADNQRRFVTSPAVGQDRSLLARAFALEDTARR